MSLAARKEGPKGLEASRAVHLPVVEFVPSGPVTLQLDRSRRIAGRIVSGAVSVAGAIVSYATLEPRETGVGGSARTDSEGRFALQITEDATLLAVAVSPPGYGLKAFAVPPEDPLTLEVSRETGTLELSRGPAGALGGEAEQLLVVLQDGHPISYQQLYQWSRGHGVVWQADSDTIRIPRLAPGNYKACFANPVQTHRAAFEEADWKAGLTGCATGYLSPGATLSLRMTD